MPYSGINQKSQLWKDSALGAISFYAPLLGNNGAEVTETPEVEIPIIVLHAPILAGADIATEVWALSSNKPLKNGTQGAIKYRFNDELLFGVISLPELGSLQNTTESAYRQIFALMQDLDYPHIYRFWNYMADINGISHEVNGGLERYRQFNMGRKEAFLAFDSDIENQLPAACALGLVDGPLVISFLLGRKAPISIQNPRQVNAHEYPTEYGPRTPSFSRATLLHTNQNKILFISGTASIVGHVTLHPQDVVAQTRETLVNLEAVIAEANRTLGEQTFNLHDIYFRVYVRYAQDWPLVQAEMARYIGGSIKTVFIQADICRQELLLEIEATAGNLLENISTL